MWTQVCLRLSTKKWKKKRRQRRRKEMAENKRRAVVKEWALRVIFQLKNNSHFPALPRLLQRIWDAPALWLAGACRGVLASCFELLQSRPLQYRRFYTSRGKLSRADFLHFVSKSRDGEVPVSPAVLPALRDWLLVSGLGIRLPHLPGEPGGWGKGQPVPCPQWVPRENSGCGLGSRSLLGDEASFPVFL